MTEISYPSKTKFEPWRMWVVQGLLAVVFLVYGFRLFSLQVINGDEYIAKANENRISQISVPTQRGIIYDRNGYVLARNVASFNVVITPANLPGYVGEPNADGELVEIDAPVQEVYRRLSEMIDVPVSNGLITDETVRFFTPCQTDFGIAQIALIGDTNSPYSEIRVACNVDQKTAMVIKERAADWPGVGIEVVPIREYPTGSLTAEVIGFLGPISAVEEEYYRSLGFQPNRDKVGYAGIEAQLNDLLMGRNGVRVVERDAAGKIIRDLEPPVEPIPGNNVKLTIDTRLQAVARESLIYWMRTLNQKLYPHEPGRYSSGVVIAMNPKTGEILAMVSYPSYENNRMARLIPAYYYEQLTLDPQKPLLNHAISAEHPPGSVFKMAPAIGFLNERVVTLDQEIYDPGHIFIEQRFAENEANAISREYVCWIYKNPPHVGHGYMNFYQGVANSCDVYFYKVGGGYEDEVPGYGLGIWRLGEYARALGYGELTGIELPGEQDGLIPDPNWKRRTQGENWSTGDTYIATMGQGYVLSTPLQMLVSIATLANDGKMMQPTIIREVLDSEGNVIKPFTPKLKRDITKEPVIQVYDENFLPTGEKKTVEPWVIQAAKDAMRLVVTEGTAKSVFEGFEIETAGKTGTAEYCDDVANEKGICDFGKWPAHAWYSGYAPYDDPEIAVVAFVYNGDEGSILAGPIVKDVIAAYFELKANDAAASPVEIP